MRDFLLLLWFALGVLSASVDPITGIAFETFSAANGYIFGIAVPLTPKSDFIGQLIVPAPATGYGGISLSGKMTNSLLIVAWANSGTVRASFRYATAHSSPASYTAKPTLSLSPIANGTYVNTTHFSYTFLCTACITNDALTFSDTAASITLAWSRSSTAVTNPSTANGASFSFHNIGQGQYSLNLTAAKSANYGTWEKWATKPAADSGK